MKNSLVFVKLIDAPDKHHNLIQGFSVVCGSIYAECVRNRMWMESVWTLIESTELFTEPFNIGYWIKLERGSL